MLLLQLSFDGLFPGDSGKLLWTENWVTFLDTMLQMIVVGLSGRSLRLPTRIRSVCIDPAVHLEKISEYTDGKKGVLSLYSKPVLVCLHVISSISHETFISSASCLARGLLRARGSVMSNLVRFGNAIHSIFLNFE